MHTFAGTYDASKRDERYADGEEVAGLEEVDGLEGLLAGHALLARELDEGVDVLHAGEVRDRLLDLLHASGLDGVGGLAEQRSKSRCDCALSKCR